MPTPDFIVQLRAKIEHAELWLPGVTAIVLRGDEVLLVRRADNREWTPVTGICDPREHPHETAIRECLEETGVAVNIERLLWVQAVGPVTYPNGDVASYVDTTFLCSVAATSGPAMVGDEENLEVKWFPVAQLPPIKPRFREAIAHAVAGEEPGWGSRPSEVR
ncbi:NUDIX hydrolase [Corynebacterium epidermidicanis]|uniref:ADP-ribose pyrophosphatase n=1 Tax=Corynebacterium epidermidicanis TaxID=1050174 RepID=A0A0G3GT19_9CORY|nr:NUDIX domain-containing protein [Corynebacterium epidermidicanis]AKK04326.1 ADP-ribose pyrophosphatase [Corynebacterium epidermidicanis]